MSDTGAMIIEVPDTPPALTDSPESEAAATETQDGGPEALENDTQDA